VPIRYRAAKGAVLLLLAGAVTLSGCAGNSRLQQGGAYAPVTLVGTNIVTAQTPDYGFFVVDASFQLAYRTLDATLQFERDNRIALWNLDPKIKTSLDAIRPKAWSLVQQYAAARAVYISNPIPAGLSSLENILAQVQRLNATVVAAIPKRLTSPPAATPPPPPPPPHLQIEKVPLIQGAVNVPSTQSKP